MKATLPQHIKLDEREHVEKPLLDQLAGLGWEVIDLTDMKQTPADTHRESFTEVVMPPVLRERLYIQSYPSACGCPITARIRYRTRRAVSCLSCQIGVRIASTSAWSRRTPAAPRCAGTHRRADCAARPTHTSLHTEEPSLYVR